MSWSDRAKSLHASPSTPQLRTYKVGDRIVGCVLCVAYEQEHHGIRDVEKVHRRDDFFSLCQTHQGRVVEVWIVKSVGAK